MAGGIVVRVPEKRPQIGLRVSLRLVEKVGGWMGGPVTTAGLSEVIAKGGFVNVSLATTGYKLGVEITTLCSSRKFHIARSAAAFEAGYRILGGVSAPSLLYSFSAQVFQSAAVKV